MDYLFISPHFDDVALSCGGWVWELARAGQRVTIATVCAARPGDGPLSRFALQQHCQWGESRDPIGTRLREDGKAARMLRAQPVYLDVPDAIYRRKPGGRPLVTSGRTLFGHGYQMETALLASVTRQIRALAPSKRATTIVAPLGTGRHVDHLLTRDAARALLATGYRVLWYEDYPYAEKRGSVVRARRAFGDVTWASRTQPIDATRKVRVIAAYVSQMHSTFRGPADMAARVESYTRRTAGNQTHAEQIWAIGPTLL